jgi:hypothetical protein
MEAIIEEDKVELLVWEGSTAAIYPLFSESKRCFDMIFSYRIGMCDFYSLASRAILA